MRRLIPSRLLKLFSLSTDSTATNAGWANTFIPAVLVTLPIALGLTMRMGQ